ncbi:MAG: helix-turn-helix domain-containing protein [Mycolicibacterium sp.]|nr:helix-turn-helix domain-containing protein [Mycolicibacterium sp.]
METVTTPLTVPDAAEALGVKAESVRRLIRAGHLSATRHGRGYVIDRADLAEYRSGAAKRREQRAAARREQLAAARLDQRRELVRAQILQELPATRGQLAAALRSAERDRVLSTVLAELITDGAVVDHGRGQALAIAQDGPTAVAAPA